MKPIAPKTLPAEIVVARGILKKAGSLLVSPGGGARRILWLCDLPDTDPAPSTLLPSLAKAGHAVVRAPSGTPFPADIDAILAVGDAKSLGDAARLIEDRRPDLPCALVPTTPEAQLAFPFLSSPELVLVDPSLPVTDAAEKRGVVELIRYAVGFDASLFDLLYTDFDPGALIRRCLTIRCDLIDAEKTDLLARLGTVIGRAVGAALSSRDGSAADLPDAADEIAIGLAAATRYALKTGYCRRDFLSELVGLLTYRGLPHSALVPDGELIAAVKNDPWADGKSLISLPRRLGECGLVPFDPDDLTGLLPD